MSFFLDLTNVEEQQGFGLIPEGTYPVIVDDAVVKSTKSGTGEYINVTYRVLDGPSKGRTLFHMFNIKNDNAKAVEIGLGQLKTFMKCSGQKEMTLKGALDLVGLRCLAVIKIKKDDQYGDKNSISYFKPMSGQGQELESPKPSTNKAASNPFA